MSGPKSHIISEETSVSYLEWASRQPSFSASTSQHILFLFLTATRTRTTSTAETADSPEALLASAFRANSRKTTCASCNGGWTRHLGFYHWPIWSPVGSTSHEGNSHPSQCASGLVGRGAASLSVLGAHTHT
jgi:hypothetical protein